MTSLQHILVLFSLASLQAVLSTRIPENCGKSSKLSIDYLPVTNSKVDQFAVGYTGVNWRVFIGPKTADVAKTTVTLSFPYKSEDDVTFENYVRTLHGTVQGGFTCDNVIKKLKGHEIDCKKATHNGMKGVFFTSKFNFPLTSQHKDFTYKIHINTNNVIQECTIANVPVTTCPMNINDQISVQSTSNYNEESKLTCKQPDAFPFKNNQPFTANVTCLANAKYGTDGIDCWKAPASTLVGNLHYKVGDSMNVKCDYVDVIPPVTQIKYSYDKGDGLKDYSTVNVDQSGGYNYTKKVENDRTDQTISCQALNLFNKMKEYEQSGVSQSQTLVILKKPTLLKSNNECTIRRSSSQKSCHQVVYSNPLVEKATLVSGNSTSEIKPSSNDGYNQTFSFAYSDFKNANGSYKLSLENSKFPGEVLSVDLNITVIDDGKPAIPTKKPDGRNNEIESTTSTPSSGSSSSTSNLHLLWLLLIPLAFQ